MAQPLSTHFTHQYHFISNFVHNGNIAGQATTFKASLSSNFIQLAG
jgi:hypothetical protein